MEAQRRCRLGEAGRCRARSQAPRDSERAGEDAGSPPWVPPPWVPSLGPPSLGAPSLGLLPGSPLPGFPPVSPPCLLPGSPLPESPPWVPPCPPHVPSLGPSSLGPPPPAVSPLWLPLVSLCPSAPPERVLEPPTESPSPPPRLTGQGQGLVVGITSVLVGVLLLLLLTWVLAAAFPRATRGNIVPNPTAIPRRQSPRHNPQPHPPGIPTLPLPPPASPQRPHSEDPSRRGWAWSRPPRFRGPLSLTPVLRRDGGGG